jgi:hypothetical protein
VVGEAQEVRAHPMVATACPMVAREGEAAWVGGTGCSGFRGEAATAREAPGEGVGGGAARPWKGEGSASMSRGGPEGRKL